MEHLASGFLHSSGDLGDEIGEVVDRDKIQNCVVVSRDNAQLAVRNELQQDIDIAEFSRDAVPRGPNNNAWSNHGRWQPFRSRFTHQQLSVELAPLVCIRELLLRLKLVL